MGCEARSRTVEREVHAVHGAATEAHLPQMSGDRRPPPRGRVEIDLRIETRQRYSVVKKFGAVRAGHDVGTVNRSADRPVRLQATAATRRQQAEILRGQLEPQIGGAVDAAIERQARAAEADTKLLEGPRVARMCQLAAAACRETSQPPAESIESDAQRIVRFEPAAADVDAKIDAAGQVGPQLARVDPGCVAADVPALCGGPGHLAVHIGVPAEDVELRPTNVDALVA